MTTFKEAFRAARKAGKKEFTWNGSRYHTRTKEEESKSKKSPPTPTPRPERKVNVPRPTPRPSVGDREKTQARASTAVTTSPGKPEKKSPPKRPVTPTPRKDAATSVNPSKMHERFFKSEDKGDKPKKTGLSIQDRKKDTGKWKPTFQFGPIRIGGSVKDYEEYRKNKK